MKSKAPLSLMEQLIMLLVFALAAALCLQVFVLSGQISRSCQEQQQAVAAVQNAAEVTKAFKGDFRQLSEYIGGSGDPRLWRLGYDNDWEPVPADDAVYQVRITPLSTGMPTLGSAEVTALSQTGELFSVTVSWQEVVRE